MHGPVVRRIEEGLKDCGVGVLDLDVVREEEKGGEGGVRRFC